MKSMHHVFDHRSEPAEQQSKNGPAQALGAGVEDGAGGAALERGQPRQAEKVILFCPCLPVAGTPFFANPNARP
jgi:hypothetical protein